MTVPELGNLIQVFVDDSDPTIQYKGNWVKETGLSTAPRTLTDPEDRPTPLYGTLHNFSGTGSGSISYMFTGEDQITRYYA